jgi:hypothetical protein
MNEQFLVLSTYGAMFTREMNMCEPEEFAKQVSARFSEFDKPPLKPQTGQNLPPDTPHIVMLSEGNRYTLEASPAKIAYRYTTPKPSPWEEAFGEFESKLQAIYGYIAENYNLKVIRLGFVVNLFAHIGSSSNQRMQEYFFKPGAKLGQPLHELQLSALSKPMLSGDVPVNRWLRLKPLRTSDKRQLDTAISVEVDINTLPEYGHDRSAKEVRSFFLSAAQFVEEKIPLLSDPDFFE